MWSEKTRRILRTVWLIILFTSVVFYAWYGKYITGENITYLLQQFKMQMLFIYLVICVLRGFTLIPSTPFLLAGILLFGSSPFLLFCVFIASIFIVATLLYYASHFLNFAAYFEKRYPEKIDGIKRKLDSRYGFYFIMLWAFAPFTPTDLICYVAGSLRMRFFKFIIPVILGEGFICLVYIFVLKNYGLH